VQHSHNDLFVGNLLDDGAIRIVDWEFAAMGDVFFDLGSLVLAYSTSGLTAELRDFILECYLGEVRNRDRAHLEQMTFMVLLCTVMWALVHHTLIRAGRLERTHDYDYLSEATGWVEILAHRPCIASRYSRIPHHVGEGLPCIFLADCYQAFKTRRPANR